jgi:hypothetical protein
VELLSSERAQAQPGQLHHSKTPPLTALCVAGLPPHLDSRVCSLQLGGGDWTGERTPKKRRAKWVLLDGVINKR